MAETRAFGTTKKEVLALADWLRCWQVRRGRPGYPRGPGRQRGPEDRP
jgi:hypothetical protein